MELEVKLEVFEGPLDLLLHLIEKNKVSIYDIPIVLITEQYLEYVSNMDKENLDVISEFMVMAATLIDIKTKMLLPPEEDENGEEIDPREELVARLVEYKTYKMLAHELMGGEKVADRSFYKAPTIPKEVAHYTPEVNLDELLGDVTLKRMQEIFSMLMHRQVDKLDPVRSKFGEIRQEPVKLADKLLSIYDFGRQRKKFTFKEVLIKAESRQGLVVSFLAILELMKIGAITASQEEVFGDINMEWNDEAGVTLSKEELEQYD
ncbi:MAG: segregation/condensation protein A [Lachnospiraceae bacterium]|nr:segregation/condensation protein A [Lachnospiraceae bacterium]